MRSHNCFAFGVSFQSVCSSKSLMISRQKSNLYLIVPTPVPSANKVCLVLDDGFFNLISKSLPIPTDVVLGF